MFCKAVLNNGVTLWYLLLYQNCKALLWLYCLIAVSKKKGLSEQHIPSDYQLEKNISYLYDLTHSQWGQIIEFFCNKDVYGYIITCRVDKH